ncbi:MAG: TerB N-terminal domain-containing protein, partial [Rickettsiales bacterium]|nr:TerB N-terminal domain-containing protein [Rickettsiales bacterium]
MKIIVFLIIIIIALYIVISSRKNKKNNDISEISNKPTSSEISNEATSSEISKEATNSEISNKPTSTFPSHLSEKIITFGFRTQLSILSGTSSRKKIINNAKWYGYKEAVNVGKYLIQDGLIYVGTSLSDDSGLNNDACLINPKLPVISAEPWQYDDDISYWPSYSLISPLCRGAYLKWLSTGRSDPKAYIGYVFLFFYSLERRLLYNNKSISASDNEINIILNEVNRLLEIYNHSRSFNSYANDFLLIINLLYEKKLDLPDKFNLLNYYNKKLITFVLANTIKNNLPIKYDLALQWFSLQDNINFRTPVRRCRKEFENLFMILYKQTYGDGLFCEQIKSKLSISYKLASPSLINMLSIEYIDLPNPSKYNAQLNKINKLVELCTNKIDNYSKYLAKNNNPDTLQAKSLLPTELLLTKENFTQLLSFFDDKFNKFPQLTSLSDIAATLSPNSEQQLSKKDIDSILLIIEKIGFGIVPDSRVYNEKLNNESQVVIIKPGHGLNIKLPKKFFSISLCVKLGAMVSKSDDDISPLEEALLKQVITNDSLLSNNDKQSLLAYLFWCLNTKQSLTGFKLSISKLPLKDRKALKRIAIAVAHADGIIHPQEIKQLEKIYFVLNLDKSSVITDIHSMAADNELVTISQKEPSPTYRLPAQPELADEKNTINFNQTAINILEKETSEIQ